MSEIDSLDKEAKSESRKPPSRQHLKAVEASKIYTTDPSKQDIVYLARELVLCTLPHSDPGDVPVWGRQNGHLTLSVKPGVRKDPDTGQHVNIGIPYGIIPRLILMWMVTEILRTRSRRLALGHHLNDFLAKIGLSGHTGRGPRSDARRVRQQMERLFRAVISFEYAEGGGKRPGTAWLDMQVAPQGVFWWSEGQGETDLAWGSWIEVGEAFYEAVVAFPMPLDVRVLRQVKDSSLGIDLYAILNREAFRAMESGRPRFLAWEWLHRQTGNEIANLRLFRRNALAQVEAILAVHSGLVVSLVKGRKGQKSGLVVSNLSTPSITPNAPRRAGTLQAGEALPAAAPPRPLRPATVEEFCRLYPRLDHRAGQAAFDAWLEGKGQEHQPRFYDRAFLGFAKKWAAGKM
jgi:hypothetical protein